MRLTKVNAQKGQALLFVVVAMTIALTVGVGLTSRTISALRRTSNTDTSSRVFSAAEGGIEWFLRQPISVLEKLADGDTNGGADCPSGTEGDSNNPAGCVVAYEPQANDQIQSKAVVTVEEFNVNSPSSQDSNYWFTLNPGTAKEVALKDYKDNTYFRGNFSLCWKSLETGQSSALYYYTYNNSGIRDKKILTPAGSTSGTLDIAGGTSASTGRYDYDSCQSISISEDTYGLRIKSLYAPSKIAVFIDPNTFPVQGFVIESTGEIDNVAEKVKATKATRVYRSLPYAPAIFDYAIYSEGTID